MPCQTETKSAMMLLQKQGTEDDKGAWKMKHKCYVQTPIGIIYIEEEEGAITALSLEKEQETVAAFPEIHFLKEPETDLLKEAGNQLMEYFQGKRKEFTLPLSPKGTEFQKKVWNALCTIPYGQTRSYGQIAAQVGNKKASRAVGGANHRNPIMIFIPCHRVIGADGSLTGFGGGLMAKKYMLDLEQKYGAAWNFD